MNLLLRIFYIFFRAVCPVLLGIGGVETSGANWGVGGGGVDLDYCDWWISVAHYYWVTSR